MKLGILDFKAPSKLRTLLLVHPSKLSGSPFAVGSTRASSAFNNSGFFSVSFLRPPPFLRTFDPVGTIAFPISSMPLWIVVLEIFLALETREGPPRPREIASEAAQSRLPFSLKQESRTSYFPRMICKRSVAAPKKHTAFL